MIHADGAKDVAGWRRLIIPILNRLAVEKSRRYWERHAKQGRDPIEMVARCGVDPVRQVVTPQTIEELEAVANGLIKSLGIRPGDTLLEVGFGSGLLLHRFQKTGANVVGIDLSPSLAAVARRLTGTEVVVGEATGLPWEDERFSFVVCEAVSHHFPSPEYLMTFLCEAIRVLRPGGQLWVGSVRNAAVVRNRLDGRGSNWFRRPIGTLYEKLVGTGLWNGYFDPELFRRVIEKAGCECEILHERFPPSTGWYDVRGRKAAESAHA